MAGVAHPPILLEQFANLFNAHIAPHVLHTWLAMGILFTLGVIVSRKLTMVPGGLQNVFEVVIGGLEDFVVANCGEAGRSVFHVLGGLFLYLVVSNLLGLVPGVDAPTANINTNAAMALVVFVYYNYIGIQHHGAGYIKHFMGPMAALAPLMLIIEFVSHLSRPLSLTLRLFGNIRGEEIVLLLLFSMAPVFATLPMYFLFMLGKVIQAFVFFMLTMLYLKGSLEHAH